MIHYKRGNLLEDNFEALVNAVNTVGVMGAGIALQFKQKFPEMFDQYEADCRENRVKLGKMHVFKLHSQTSSPKYIINFPTLEHWSDQATLETIEAGLRDLVRVIKEQNIHSIAIPPLGCGIGGLKWEDVKVLIEQTFRDEDIQVHLYEPL